MGDLGECMWGFPSRLRKGCVVFFSGLLFFRDQGLDRVGSIHLFEDFWKGGEQDRFLCNISTILSLCDFSPYQITLWRERGRERGREREGRGNDYRLR